MGGVLVRASGEMTDGEKRNASALDICTHPPPCPFRPGNLSLPRAGEETTSMAGRRLPETGDGRSAISADRARVCLCAHVCAHVGMVIKTVRSHYSCWRRGAEDSPQGTVYIYKDYGKNLSYYMFYDHLMQF